MKNEDDGYTDYNWYAWYNHQRKGIVTGRLGDRKNGDYPNYNINTIGQNTEKSPAVLTLLAISQTPV